MRALCEIAAQEITDRDDIQESQARAIHSAQQQLDHLLDMATKGLLSADEYESKSGSLKNKLLSFKKNKERLDNE